ncbi:hypothetical protein [Brevibacillus agri]|uniref:hypothetical protein n=1 Tax=Brevibacillus agri TaxID=51101 RepID=UPI001EE5F45C|nr:hypothetical protein [Brevibacillus agri]MCG5252586.1 hypothetical protein [Brevibacillus agri]
MTKINTIGGVQYREIKRKAEVGEKIKVVSAAFTFGKYREGDVFTVKSQSPRGNCVVVEETGVYIRHSEYVVLEPVAPADIIVHDGKQYRKVDRPVREGDAFVIPKLRRYTTDLTSGKVYALGRDSDGDAYFYDDVEDARYNPIRENDVYVLEPVAPQTAQSALSALETELAATKAKVAEMEAQLAAAVAAQRKKAETEAQPLKVGDYAKVVEPTAGFSAKGQIVKITKVDDSDIPYNTQGMDGKYTGWHEATDLVRVTDEEVAEAKRDLAFDQFVKGEKVRLISGGGKFPLHGFADGDVYEVVTPRYEGHSHGTKVRLATASGTIGFANPDQLAKLTAEELAEIERKKAEEAKWAAIGRKSGEFKVGDIVKQATIKDVGYGVVTEVIEDRAEYRVLYSNNTYGSCAEPIRLLELVAPVESVVNLRGGDVA